MSHASHPDIVLRLKRASGHLASVIEMFAAERPCAEIAQQLHAVEAAITKAKREMIHDHIQHCLTGEAEGAMAEIEDLKQITRYL